MNFARFIGLLYCLVITTRDFGLCFIVSEKNSGLCAVFWIVEHKTGDYFAYNKTGKNECESEKIVRG